MPWGEGLINFRLEDNSETLQTIWNPIPLDVASLPSAPHVPIVANRLELRAMNAKEQLPDSQTVSLLSPGTKIRASEPVCHC